MARPAAIANCNAAIFENNADILVVDTHSKPSAVASLVAQVRKEITAKPIRYIVNTHFHWDHTQGTPAYKRIAPRADVLASSQTRNLLAENGASRFKESLEQAQKNLEASKDKLGAALSEAEKSYHQKMVSELGAYIAEMRNYAPELPNTTIDRELVIHDKAHELHLAFRGRGHTAGDVVVFCPQKKVIATGDLLHGFLPFIADGYPLDWPRTLYTVAELEFEHVIGGHGGVQHTRDRLYQMAAYIEELTDAVVKGKQAGRTVAELKQTITPATLKSLERRGYGRFLLDSVAKYRLQVPGMSQAASVASGVGTNIEHTFAALDRS